MDLSESLPALQSDLRSYWERGVSLKRDRPELVNLCLGEDISEEEMSEMNRVPTTLVQPEDRGYDSCDSEDLASCDTEGATWQSGWGRDYLGLAGDLRLCSQ